MTGNSNSIELYKHFKPHTILVLCIKELEALQKEQSGQLFESVKRILFC